MDKVLGALLPLLFALSVIMAVYWLVKFVHLSILFHRVKALRWSWEWAISGALVASSVASCVWALSGDAYGSLPLWLYLLTLLGLSVLWVYGFFATLVTVGEKKASYKEAKRTQVFTGTPL